MTSMPGGVCTDYGNFYCSLPGGVRAHHGLFRTRAFETPATFHKIAKSHWTVQWFIQANQKTSPSPLLINIDVTLSIGNRLQKRKMYSTHRFPSKCLIHARIITHPTLPCHQAWFILKTSGACFSLPRSDQTRLLTPRS